MAYALAHGFEPTVASARRTVHADDSLDAMRGIIAWTLASLLVFWLPLAFALIL